MPLAALQRSKPTTKTRAQPKPAHAVISQSTTPTTTFHPIVQAKLCLGAPNDNYEREADHVADQVMREQGPAPESTLDFPDSPETVQRKCAACSSGGSGLCPECEEEVQRHALPVTPLVQRKMVDSVSGMNIQLACACGGTCTSCAGKENERGEIQTKLAIGQPGDVYEREADRVADEVVAHA